MIKPPPLIIICGPTAVGKTTVIRKLLRQHPEIQSSITYTTRSQRPHSTEDKHMIYVTENKFQQLKKEGKLLEWALYSGDLYGTAVDSFKTEGRPLLLNLEIRGSLALKRRYPHSLTIFILPEGKKQLYQRLQRRRLTAQELQERYEAALTTLAKAPLFDHRVINHQGQVNRTVRALEGIISTYLRPLTKA